MANGEIFVGPSRVVTVEALAKAFQAWNHGVRTQPVEYLTQAEADALGVDELSAGQATYFFQLLGETK